jgi:transposase
MNAQFQYVLGIDISMEKFDTHLIENTLPWQKGGSSTVFENAPKGFGNLRANLRKVTTDFSKILAVMEATGTYYEPLAYELHKLGVAIRVVLPNLSANFAASLNLKSRNDKVDAMMLARMGVERELRPWSPMDPIHRLLRTLSRERKQYMESRSIAKNQLHAVLKSGVLEEKTIARFKKQIALFNELVLEIEAQVKEVLKTNPDVEGKVKLLSTIPGIQTVTAIMLIGETDGFSMISNKKTLISYAGLDVRKHVSGSSVNKRSRISKKGNSHIRGGLFVPSWTARRINPECKALNDRVFASTGLKMKGLVAVMRKMLVQAYFIYKSDLPFDSEYQANKNEKANMTKQNVITKIVNMV